MDLLQTEDDANEFNHRDHLSRSHAVAGSDLFVSTPARTQTCTWARQAYSSQLVPVWSLGLCEAARLIRWCALPHVQT